MPRYPESVLVTCLYSFFLLGKLPKSAWIFGSMVRLALRVELERRRSGPGLDGTVPSPASAFASSCGTSQADKAARRSLEKAGRLVGFPVVGLG